jgi:hypothetical protein
VKALNIKGIYFQKEFQRFYPDNQIAAQVLGYVGVRRQRPGRPGRKIRAAAARRPGRMYTAMDARRKVLGSSEHEPEPGQNLVLTIDENIQFMAERALDHAMEKTQATTAPWSCRTCTPGRFWRSPSAPLSIPTSFATPRRRCCATTPSATSTSRAPPSSWSRTPPPGSARGHARRHDRLPGRQITSPAASFTTTRRTLRRHSRCTRRSSTPATWPPSSWRSSRPRQASTIHSRLRISARARRGAARRNARPAAPVSQLGPSSIGSIAIGQEVAVTPLQLVSMVSTIANGGVYLPPHVLMPGQVGEPPKSLPHRRWPQPRPSSRAAKICPIRCPPARTASSHHDRRPDAQDDGRRRALRHRQAGAAQRLLLRRQNRHRAKDRSGHAHLFEDHAHRLVRGLRAGQQSGHLRGRGHRFPKGRRTTAPRLRAGLCRGGAAGA